jgi:hypothetical protein
MVTALLCRAMVRLCWLLMHGCVLSLHTTRSARTINTLRPRTNHLLDWVLDDVTMHYVTLTRAIIDTDRNWRFLVFGGQYNCIIKMTNNNDLGRIGKKRTLSRARWSSFFCIFIMDASVEPSIAHIFTTFRILQIIQFGLRPQIDYLLSHNLCITSKKKYYHLALRLFILFQISPTLFRYDNRVWCSSVRRKPCQWWSAIANATGAEYPVQ